MNLQVDVERLLLAQKTVRAELVSERAAGGYWPGHLAGSPLATAAAVSALVTSHRSGTEHVLRDDVATSAESVAEHVVQGDLCEFLLESVHWLAQNQNDDGGWGDCIGARSNIAATLMVQAAFRLTGIPAKYDDLMVRADQLVAEKGGISALRRDGREDRTFVAAVLTNCALAGIVPWRQVPALPFALACLPASWQRRVQMPVARTSLPLFLAVGRAKFHHDPPRNPLSRILRRSMRTKSLSLLAQLQASDDSFSGSVATTAFVVLCLSSIGCQDHPIVQRGVEFLLSNVRGDSSWPVEPNLTGTVTALALQNLADRTPPELPVWQQDTAIQHETVTEQNENPLSAHHTDFEVHALDDEQLFDDGCLDWLLAGQRTERNPVTECSPGGWAPSDAKGALPDTTATADTLRILSQWPLSDQFESAARIDRAASLGVGWLLGLQNDDGGWASFNCAADGYLTDISGPDTTSRALGALAAWKSRWQAAASAARSLPAGLLDRIDGAIHRGWQYLETSQREDGSFIPLWFGDELQPKGINPVIGTSLALAACADLGRSNWDLAHRAAIWLVSNQHTGGGWGPPRTPVDYSNAENDGFRARRANEAMAKSASVEETALALNALLPLADSNPAISKAVSAGINWLVNAVEQDAHRRPAVIGFYRSRIWYHERLYPLLFAVGALTRATHQLALERPATARVS
jgi:squalene-hopene/tetraprenyl-beta-curcumene cyclase